MLIYGKTPKDWKQEIVSKTLYYRREIAIAVFAFVLGALVF